MAALLAIGVSPAGAGDPRAGWEGWHVNRASGCAARVQVPFVNGNQQVAAYTEVFCPRATQLTVRSRLRSDYAFRDIIVAQQGCVRDSCVVTQPKGYAFYKLTCPRSANPRTQRYFTDIIIFPGTDRRAASPFPQRSGPATLSPNCAY
jgi:hypothetical protein